MIEIRIHGRGGQGVVTAAELLVGRGLRRGPARPGLPHLRLRAHRGAGRRRSAGSTTADPAPRADRRARTRWSSRTRRCCTRSTCSPGSTPDGYLLVNTCRDLAELGLDELAGRLAPGPRASPCRPPSSPASTSAGRCPTRPCSAASRRSPARSSLGAVAGRDPGAVPAARSARRNVAAADAGVTRQVRQRARGGRPMLSQIEGSQAVAPSRSPLCRPAGGRGLPDLAADPHRRGARRTWSGPASSTACEYLDGRVRVRRDVGLHRRLGGRRPHLHRHRQPGPAVHGRGALQRLRPRAADRDDGGQPRHRRADQHLERPLRLDVACATPAGSSSTPSPTRRRSTCTSRRSGSPSRCRCR